MTFFKNDTPEQIAQLRERIAKLEERLLRNEQTFAGFIQRLELMDADAEEAERELRARIDDLGKLARSGSLPKEQEKQPETAMFPGYKSWSQRKAERIAKSADSGFAMRMSNRGKKVADAEGAG
jgi:type I site-specific restriction endonuclease